MSWLPGVKGDSGRAGKSEQGRTSRTNPTSLAYLTLSVCERTPLLRRISRQQRVREIDDVFEPQRFEVQLGAELRQLAGNAFVERVVRRHDGNRRGLALLARTEPVEKTKTVDQRHPQVHDDRVRVEHVGL